MVLAYRPTLEHRRKDRLPKVETPIKILTGFLVNSCAIVQTSGPTVIRYGAKELKPSAYVRRKLGIAVAWNMERPVVEISHAGAFTETRPSWTPFHRKAMSW